MEPLISPLLFALLLFVGMLSMLEVGRRLGLARRQRETDGDRGNLSAIEGAVFAVFGLLIAFTFSGAASRFNEKRMLIAQEVNAIQTAYLRVQLLPQEQRPALQDLFRRYVDSRLDYYRKIPDRQAAAAELAASEQLQKQMWADAVGASELPGAHRDAGKLLLPALNAMIASRRSGPSGESVRVLSITICHRRVTLRAYRCRSRNRHEPTMWPWEGGQT